MSEKLREIHRTRPELRLLRQNDFVFPAAVAMRAFVGEGMIEVPEPTFLRIVDEVKEELATSGEERRENGASYYLKSWLGHFKSDYDAYGGAPWFGTEVKSDGEKVVTLLAHSRRALGFIESLGLDQSLVTMSSLASLASDVEESAARISGDVSRRRAVLERRLTEISEELDQLDQAPPEPATDLEREAVATKLVDDVSRMLNGFSGVPTELRRFNRECQDLTYSATGPARDVVFEIKERERVHRSGQAYAILTSLRELQMSDVKREALQENISFILRECDRWIEPDQRRRLEGFVGDLVRVASDILAEEAASSRQLHGYIRHPDFAERREAAKSLQRVRTMIGRVRDEMRPAVRDKRLDGVGIRLTVPGEVSRVCDVALSDQLPTPPQKPAPPPAPISKDGAGLAGRSIMTLNKGRYLSDRQGLARIKLTMRDVEEPTLLDVIERHPLRFGIHELALYMRLASSAIPCTFDPGEAIELTVDEMDCRLVVNCPNPRFTHEGRPAAGLVEFNAGTLLKRGAALSSSESADPRAVRLPPPERQTDIQIDEPASAGEGDFE